MHTEHFAFDKLDTPTQHCKSGRISWVIHSSPHSKLSNFGTICVRWHSTWRYMCLNPLKTTKSARSKKILPILRKPSLNSTTNTSTNTNDKIPSDDNPLDNNMLPRRSASFSTIQIREYPITLGNNPGGAKGPPITLEWKHDDEKTLVTSLEEYEKKRPPRRDDLHIPECVRRWRLLEKGFSMREMRKASSDAEFTRRQRKKTIQQLTFPSNCSVRDKVRNLLNLNRSFCCLYQKVGSRIWDSTTPIKSDSP